MLGGAYNFSFRRFAHFFCFLFSFHTDLHEDIRQSGRPVDSGQAPGFRVLRPGNTFPSEYTHACCSVRRMPRKPAHFRFLTQKKFVDRKNRCDFLKNTLKKKKRSPPETLEITPHRYGPKSHRVLCSPFTNSNRFIVIVPEVVYFTILNKCYSGFLYIHIFATKFRCYTQK